MHMSRIRRPVFASDGGRQAYDVLQNIKYLQSLAKPVSTTHPPPEKKKIFYKPVSAVQHGTPISSTPCPWS